MPEPTALATTTSQRRGAPGCGQTWQVAAPAVLCLLLMACAPAGRIAPLASVETDSPAARYWQAQARADLDAVRSIIERAHPGMIDEGNPEFPIWVDQGHAYALALLPQVFSHDSMKALVRSYTSGFLDGHLGYVDDNRSCTERVHTTGWRVRLDEASGRDRWLVHAVTPNPGSPTPAVGDELVECDGMPVETLLAERVAPRVDRRPFAAANSPAGFSGVRRRLGGYLDRLLLAGEELRSCSFLTVDGARRSVAVAYAGIESGTGSRPLVEPYRPTRPERRNSMELLDGVLWIRAAQFELGREEALALETMLFNLGQLRSNPRTWARVHTIVFDTRNNGGGDSLVGSRIFDAATGGLVVNPEGLDQLPETYALWRVSPELLDLATAAMNQSRRHHGRRHPQTIRAEQFVDEVAAALSAGASWVKQAGGPQLSSEEMRRRDARLKGFAGRVVLLTDDDCASACLDFADLVRLVPDSLHVGETTSADTVYLELATVRLPRGNSLYLPLKVWRNRVRGHNQALVPDRPLALRALDESRLREAVLQAAAR